MREQDYSPLCGILRCGEETIVNIWKFNITRCGKHYCQDYDKHKTGHVQDVSNPEKFNAEDDIMDALADCNMLQNHGETKKDYSLRCKNSMPKDLKRIAAGVKP